MSFRANPLLSSLSCAWVQTSDLDQAAALCTEAIGLAVLDAGKADAHWAAGGTGSRWVLLGDPDESAGRLCLVEGEERSRDGGLPRGLDSVEIVVADVDRVGRRLDSMAGVHRLGQSFVADLAELGGNQHRSALWRMPWGTHLIITAGVTQTPGREFPSTEKEAGRVFEVHLRTDRYDDGLRLYRDAFEMPSLMTACLDRGPIHQAWSIPEGVPVAMDLLKTGPEGTGLGAVELQGHRTDRLQPATRGGTLGLTFACADLDALRRSLQRIGRDDLEPVAAVAAGPYAGVPGFTISGVEGERLEFVAAEAIR